MGALHPGPASENSRTQRRRDKLPAKTYPEGLFRDEETGQ
jgi:hypothetical protein